MNSLQDRGVGLRSLQEAIDTTTPAGKLTFHIFAALAEFERDMIRERTSAGLAAARKRGVAIGRPRALTPEQILMAECDDGRPRHLNTSGGGAVWYPPLDALSAPSTLVRNAPLSVQNRTDLPDTLSGAIRNYKNLGGTK